MSLTEYSPPTHLTTLEHRETASLVMAWLGSYSSAKTREAYGYSIRRFAEYLEFHNAGGLLEATRPHIDMFARGLESASYSNATRAQWLSALSSFYDYSCSVNALTTNPAANGVSIGTPTLPVGVGGLRVAGSTILAGLAAGATTATTLSVGSILAGSLGASSPAGYNPQPGAQYTMVIAGWRFTWGVSPQANETVRRRSDFFPGHAGAGRLQGRA